MLISLIRALNLFIDLLEWCIFIQVISSWVPQIRRYHIFKYIDLMVDPISSPFRNLQLRLMPNSMIDFSPIFAYMLLEFIRKLIVNIIF